MKNKLGGSTTQQELRGWGSQWNEQENWGLNPPPTPVNSNPACYYVYHSQFSKLSDIRTAIYNTSILPVFIEDRAEVWNVCIYYADTIRIVRVVRPIRSYYTLGTNECEILVRKREKMKIQNGGIAGMNKIRDKKKKRRNTRRRRRRRRRRGGRGGGRELRGVGGGEKGTGEYWEDDLEEEV